MLRQFHELLGKVGGLLIAVALGQGSEAGQIDEKDCPLIRSLIHGKTVSGAELSIRP